MINNFEIDTGGRRRIMAPSSVPSFYGKRNTATGDIISVWVHPDELVKWIWTSDPDGSRRVTGYEITKVK